MSAPYPPQNCEKHPNLSWTWDGYVWICEECILDYQDVLPNDPPRPVDLDTRVRNASKRTS